MLLKEQMVDYLLKLTHLLTYQANKFGNKLFPLKFHIINYIMKDLYPSDVNHVPEELTQANMKEKEDGGGKMFPKKNVVSILKRKNDFYNCNIYLMYKWINDICQ